MRPLGEEGLAAGRIENQEVLALFLWGLLFPHLDGEIEDLVQVLNLCPLLDKPSPKD